MKTRLVLAGFALLMFLAFILGIDLLQVYGYSKSPAGILDFVLPFLLILPPLPFFSALIMLGFSLFRVETLPDGRLVYDPANPYWRLMRKLWKVDFSANISVCKACMLTSLSLLGCLIILMVVFVLGMMARLYSEGQLSKVNWQGVVLGLRFMASLAIPVLIANRLAKFGRERQIKILEILGQGIIYLWLFSFFVIFPVYGFMYKEHLGLFSAILVYLQWAGIIVGPLLLIWGALCLVFFIGEKTILGQWLRALKSDFCPILNPVKVEEKS